MTEDVIDVVAPMRLKEAVSLMAERKISFLIVSEGCRPIGVLTERDIVRILDEGQKFDQLRVEDVMNSPVITIGLKHNVFQAYDMLGKHSVRHLVVVDGSGFIAGLVTLSNFLDELDIEYFIKLKNASNIMSHHVLTASPEDSIAHVVGLMSLHRVSCILMVENDQPIGIFTERDVTKLSAEQTQRFEEPISRVMSQPVCCVDLHAFIPEVRKQMQKKGIRHLAVTNNLGHLAGLVTQSDVARCMEGRYVDYLRQIIMDKDRQLNASENSLFRHNPNAVFILDLNGDVQSCNAPASILSGLHEKKMVGTSFLEMLRSRDQQQASCLLQSAANGNAESFNAYLLGNRDCETLTLINFVPTSEKNNLQQIYAVVFDITDRCEAEESLMRIEHLFEVVSQSTEQLIGTDDLHTVIDDMMARLGKASAADSVYVYENDWNSDPNVDLSCKLRHEWGYSQEFSTSIAVDTTGMKRWADQLAANQPVYGRTSDFPKYERVFLEGRGIKSLVLIPIFSGSTWWGLIGFSSCNQAHAWSIAEVEALRIAAKSIGSALYRQTMEETHHKLSQALEQAGESVIITNTHGIIEYVNPAFSRITGYSKEEAVGKNPRMLKSGKQKQSFYEKLWQTVNAGNVWSGKLVDRRKDGSLYPAMLTIAPIRNNDEGITGYIGTQQDLTEYQELEAQFQQAQKMEAIGVLVGGMAHDFNNMLGGMTGNLFLTKKHVQQSPEALARIESVEKLGYRAADMVRQLLTFARNERVEMQPLVFGSFVKEAVKLAAVTVPENIELRCRIETNDATIQGDVTQLQQVIMNLLNNARDAMGDSKYACIEVIVSMFDADETFMSQHDRNEKKFVCLQVKDNGCGIPQEEREHVFDAFFTTKDAEHGTGLGLTMVKSALQRHEGVIDISSSAKNGTCFSLYFPLLKAEAVEESRIDDQFVPGSGEWILYAEDDPIIRDTIKEMLEDVGFRLLAAEHGEEALEIYKANREKIKLVMLDVVMPHISGHEVAATIRTIDANMPLIFMTAYEHDSGMDTLTNLERSIVLKKPCPPETLIKHLHELI
ncbi:MAG: CBS domain-containing protein [Mariprofundaceae bacterium]